MFYFTKITWSKISTWRKIYILIGIFFAVIIFGTYYYENKANIQTSFICPENYTDSKKYDADLYSLVLNYIKNNPKATIDDATTYRYSLLVSNNCRTTLDYIKTMNYLKNGTSSSVSDLDFFKQETLSAMQDQK